MRAVWIVLLGLGAPAVQADAPPALVKREAYTARLSVPAASQLQVALEALAGYHLNDDYPLHFTPSPSPSTKWQRTRVDKQDGIVLVPCKKDPAHACGATVSLGYSATRSVRLAGTLAFSLCDEDRCLIEKVELSLPAP